MIFLDNRKIFISGGAGVIGAELVKRLDKRGADLFVGDGKHETTQMLLWPIQKRLKLNEYLVIFDPINYERIDDLISFS